MIDEILINTGLRETRVALVAEGRLQEVLFWPGQGATLVGRIYLGRVRRIEAALEAAFVDIGEAQAGFLGLVHEFVELAFLVLELSFQLGIRVDLFFEVGDALLYLDARVLTQLDELDAHLGAELAQLLRGFVDLAANVGGVDVATREE